MSYITRQQQAVLSCLSQRREQPLTVNDLELTGSLTNVGRSNSGEPRPIK